MEFDVPGILNMIWAAVAATLIGFALGPVRKFFAKNDDNRWIELAKTVITDIVDALDQAIEQGNMTKQAARATAVRQAANALTANRSDAAVKKATGMTATELAEVEVEAAVNRKRAVQKAVEAGSVSVGPN